MQCFASSAKRAEVTTYKTIEGTSSKQLVSSSGTVDALTCLNTILADAEAAGHSCVSTKLPGKLGNLSRYEALYQDPVPNAATHCPH